MSEKTTGVYEGVKNWHLRPSNWGKDLMHQHFGTFWLCNKHKDGYWYCFKCGTVAPEEIQFIADLAPCWCNVKAKPARDIPDHLLQCKRA